MPIRGGILLISAAGIDDTALARVHGLLTDGLDGFFLQISRAYPAPPRYQVEETLRRWCDEEELDLLVTVGGTFPAAGPAPAEIVPEATAAVIERALPGLPEAMRAWAAEESSQALLDRGVAGIRGRTLLVNLPGDPALTGLFLDGIWDVIPLVLARIAEPGMAQSSESDASPGGLQPQEFAAFLQKRGRRSG